MTAIAAVCLLLAQSPEEVMQAIQRSHVEANVPAQADFARFLSRDLEGHFNAGHSKTLRIEHELLRDGPTQAGVSYPKYYVWVRVLDKEALVTQGAAVLVAIDRKRFEVSSYASEVAIRAEPGRLYRVFPALVCETIGAKLGIALDAKQGSQ